MMPANLYRRHRERLNLDEIYLNVAHAYVDVIGAIMYYWKRRRGNKRPQRPFVFGRQADGTYRALPTRGDQAIMFVWRGKRCCVCLVLFVFVAFFNTFVPANPRSLFAGFSVVVSAAIGVTTWAPHFAEACIGGLNRAKSHDAGAASHDADAASDDADAASDDADAASDDADAASDDAGAASDDAGAASDAPNTKGGYACDTTQLWVELGQSVAASEREVGAAAGERHKVAAIVMHYMMEPLSQQCLLWSQLFARLLRVGQQE